MATTIQEGRGGIIFTFDGEYIYEGRSTSSSKILFTFDGNYLYKGRSTSSSNILFTIRGAFSIGILPVIL